MLCSHPYTHAHAHTYTTTRGRFEPSQGIDEPQHGEERKTRCHGNHREVLCQVGAAGREEETLSPGTGDEAVRG